MNNVITKPLGKLTFLLSIMIIGGCAQKHLSTDQSVLVDIRTQSGLVLSTNSQILAAGDAESRTPGFYEWTVYLKAPEHYSITNMDGSKNIVRSASADDSPIRLIESVLKKRIEAPLDSYSGVFETALYQWQYTVVRTATGDYLDLRRLSKTGN
jgi:hypothetical protein